MSDVTPPPPPMVDYPMPQGLTPNLDPANAPKNVGFFESVSRAFKQYAKFSGRASRSEYWWFALFLFLCQVPFGVLVGAAQSDSNLLAQIGGILIAAFPLALLIPSLALTSRRIHDTGRSAKLYFGLLIGMVVFSPFLYVFVFIGLLASFSGAGIGLAIFVLLPFIALGIYALVLTTGPSTPGANNYGPGLS